MSGGCDFLLVLLIFFDPELVISRAAAMQNFLASESRPMQASKPNGCISTANSENVFGG